MIASRRPLGARHEFRLGTRELVVLGVLVALVSGLTFALGVVVGRETGTRPRLAAAPVVETPPPSHEQSGKPTPARADEKLTFYRTLTAPTTDLGAAGKGGPPVIEERLVPREEPAASADDEAARAQGRPRPATPPPPTAARGRPAAPPRPQPTPSRPTQVAAVPAPSAVAPQVPQAAPGGVEPQLWTIQVSSFRSKALAEELRARLQTRGLDAYLLSAATEEGRVRYRVRVGAYQSRSEAERVASELRSERTLSPFVTPRSR